MRRETTIGIAIELIGNGTGAGLQMVGIMSVVVGWVIIGISNVVGLLIIGYGLGKGAGQRQNERQQPKKLSAPSGSDTGKTCGGAKISLTIACFYAINYHCRGCLPLKVG